MDTIHQRLRIERERLGLNQTNFGALGNASKPTQVRYENGGGSPDAKYLAAVSEAGVDVLYVLTGRREPRHYEENQTLVSTSALERAVALVEQGLRDNNRELAPDKYAQLVIAVVDFLADDADDVVADRIANIIRLAV